MPWGVCFIATARFSNNTTTPGSLGRLCLERNRETVRGQAEQVTALIRLILLISKGEVFLFPEGIPPSALGFSLAGLMVCHSLVGRANHYLSSSRSAAVGQFYSAF